MTGATWMIAVPPPRTVTLVSADPSPTDTNRDPFVPDVSRVFAVTRADAPGPNAPKGHAQLPGCEGDSLQAPPEDVIWITASCTSMVRFATTLVAVAGP